MSEKEAIKHLRGLGLTEYEARVYAALTKIKTGVALDIHLLSGIPRSAVYGVLEKLREKGIVEIQHAKPMKYRIVSPKKALEKLKNNFLKESKEALESLEKIYGTPHEKEIRDEGVWTITGISNIADKIMEMVEKAKSDIIFIAEHPFTNYFNIKSLLNKKIEKGTKIRMIGSNRDEINNIKKEIDIEARIRSNIPKGGIIIVDGVEAMITVFTEPPRNMIAIWSEGEGFLSIFKHWVEMEWNDSIAL
ncbi:MAG: TrmB family transcriptional regulator [Candidatus Syntropharchaeia archaeon]